MSTPNYITPPVSSDPGALYNDFVAFMQAQIPGWKPYSGELDDWLARAFTAIASQLMEITSDAATSVFRYFGAFIMGYPPLDATSATASVTINVQDSLGYTVPAFTSFSFPDGSGNLQGFETTSATVFAPSGSTSQTVTVQAMVAGSAANGCSGAGNLDSATPITFITGLSMAASSSGGTDAEDDSAYLGRLTSLMTTVTPSPITTGDFTTIAMAQSGVGRAFTLGAFNPANWTTTGNTHTSTTIDTIASTANIPVGASISGSGIPANTFVTKINSSTAITISAATTSTLVGTTLTIGGQLNQGGYVTSFLVDANGNDPGSTVRSAVQTAIQNMCLVNVTYTTEPATYTTVAVTATVLAWADPTNPPSSVQTAVQAAITNFLSPLVFGQQGTAGEQPWLNETVVRLAALQTVIMSVPGVHYVSALTINGSAADLPLGGVVPLLTPGAVSATVTVG